MFYICSLDGPEKIPKFFIFLVWCGNSEVKHACIIKSGAKNLLLVSQHLSYWGRIKMWARMDRWWYCEGVFA
jgi:hypothetical protein